jgi:hypothetical protein
MFFLFYVYLCFLPSFSPFLLFFYPLPFGGCWKECYANVLMCGKRVEDPIKGTQYDHYERTVAMLNDTMGLCLR